MRETDSGRTIIATLHSRRRRTRGEVDAGYFGHWAGFHVASIGGCEKTARGQEYVVLVRWIGPEDEEAIRESTPLMQKIPRLL